MLNSLSPSKQSRSSLKELQITHVLSATGDLADQISADSLSTDEFFERQHALQEEKKLLQKQISDLRKAADELRLVLLIFFSPNY